MFVHISKVTKIIKIEWRPSTSQMELIVIFFFRLFRMSIRLIFMWITNSFVNVFSLNKFQVYAGPIGELRHIESKDKIKITKRKYTSFCFLWKWPIRWKCNENDDYDDVAYKYIWTNIIYLFSEWFFLVIIPKVDHYLLSR